VVVLLGNATHNDRAHHRILDDQWVASALRCKVDGGQTKVFDGLTLSRQPLPYQKSRLAGEFNEIALAAHPIVVDGFRSRKCHVKHFVIAELHRDNHGPALRA